MGGGQIPWKKALRNTWMAPMNVKKYSKINLLIYPKPNEKT